MIYMRTYYSISSKNFYIKIKSPFQIYTLSLHDALPISFWGQSMGSLFLSFRQVNLWFCGCSSDRANRDRKSTRLNSSHRTISYAVFCLKKKKNYICRVSLFFNLVEVLPL